MVIEPTLRLPMISLLLKSSIGMFSSNIILDSQMICRSVSHIKLPNFHNLMHRTHNTLIFMKTSTELARRLGKARFLALQPCAQLQ